LERLIQKISFNAVKENLEFLMIEPLKISRLNAGVKDIQLSFQTLVPTKVMIAFVTEKSCSDKDISQDKAAVKKLIRLFQ
jgi:hypothetical protein